jgi:exopolyphosphatase / guanosine-5'-triphosphate,3'-diphosphate pyrophosphatase
VPVETDALAKPTSPDGVRADAIGAESPRAEPARPEAMREVAVIDVGTTSLRMAVAQIGESGRIRTLETLSQAVTIGKDTFTGGNIRRDTIEAGVRALRDYRKVLEQYRITDPSAIRVVATSAVREAQNRLAFLDRVFSATGFQIEPIDEAEVNRITYLGVQPQLSEDPELAAAKTIVTEVGGGSTEVLLLHEGQVLHSSGYRLGSLRMREQLEAYRAPAAKMRSLVSEQIERTMDHVVAAVRQHAAPGERVELLALGGDVRYAASQLVPEWPPDEVGRIPIDAFSNFTERMLRFDEEELVRRFHLTFPDAETLGPALLAYRQLARAFELEHVLVSNVNLRDGLLREMAGRGRWSSELERQIIRSAIDLGRKFHFDEKHHRRVASLAVHLFHALQREHDLPPRYEVLLHAAALLHGIGSFVSGDALHKHSYYLISNSDLFGLGKRDVLIVALVARYHRRASPKGTHAGFSTLDREERIAVSKLAAILRVGDALDRSHAQRITEVDCRLEKDRLVLLVPHVADLTLEQLALRQKGSLFEEIFGRKVLLRPKPV